MFRDYLVIILMVLTEVDLMTNNYQPICYAFINPLLIINVYNEVIYWEIRIYLFLVLRNDIVCNFIEIRTLHEFLKSDLVR